MKLREPQIALDEIKAMAATGHLLVYGATTCWWRVLQEGEPIGYERPGPDLGPNPAIRRADGWNPGLPCDPRGGMLFQIVAGSIGPDGGEPRRLATFIEAAEANPGHYGRHGLAAFVAAHHGNVLTDDGRPTCFASWEEYSLLLDGVGR